MTRVVEMLNVDRCASLCRYADVLHRRLCEDPVERLVRAGHRCDHSTAGRSAAAHAQHRQHLGLLHGLRPLQGLLPVPGADRHVGVK